jgi:hypothetical protein
VGKDLCLDQAEKAGCNYARFITSAIFLEMVYKVDLKNKDNKNDIDEMLPINDDLFKSHNADPLKSAVEILTVMV